MRKFLKELNLFLIPIYAFVVWCLLSIAILSHYSVMYYDTEKLMDTNEKSIVGFGLKQVNLEKYKWAYLQEKPAVEIWSLGSSRVLHFREQMFSKSFYNAGYTIRNPGDFKVFMETFEREMLPDFVIIGLDQWLFNEARDQRIDGRNPSVWKDWDVWQFDMDLYKRLWVRILNGEFKDNHVDQDGISYYGLNANLNGRGIRNDGSIDYGIDIELLLDRDSEKLRRIKDDIIRSINTKDNRFESGDSVAPQSVAELTRFLALCKENEIEVIGFLPPFADFTIDLMQKDGGYTYIDMIYPVLEPVFDEFGYELYDFTTLGSFGSDDSEILDGFHVAEIGYQKMLLEILRRNTDSVLSEYVDQSTLEADIESPINELVVYDY